MGNERAVLDRGSGKKRLFVRATMASVRPALVLLCRFLGPSWFGCWIEPAGLDRHTVPSTVPRLGEGNWEQRARDAATGEPAAASDY